MNIGLYSYYKVHNNNRMILNSSAQGGGDNTNYPVVLLAKILKEQGHAVSTIDTGHIENYDKIIFLEFPEIRRTGRPNKYLKKLIKNKFKEMYLVCMEPEAIKPNNWVKENHRYFKKIFTWHDDYVDGHRYIRIHSTSHRKEEKVLFDFKEKTKLCALIVRNKFSNHPHELYSERRKVIRWFEQNRSEDFDLYGIGWDRFLSKGIFIPFNLIDGCLRRSGNILSRYYGPNNIFHRLAKFSKWLYLLLYGKNVEYTSYRGQITSVREVLKKYKFAICFENSCFPGWITERIFDCFLAGCIPIYLGDPNITRRIPIDTFIDAKQFESYERLYDYIKNIDKVEYMKYIEAIRNFINSENNFSFTAEYFAETIIREIF